MQTKCSSSHRKINSSSGIDQAHININKITYMNQTQLSRNNYEQREQEAIGSFSSVVNRVVESFQNILSPIKSFGWDKPLNEHIIESNNIILDSNAHPQFDHIAISEEENNGNTSDDDGIENKISRSSRQPLMLISEIDCKENLGNTTTSSCQICDYYSLHLEIHNMTSNKSGKI